MAVKYRLEVSSQKGDDWRVDIDVPGYAGDLIPLIGARDPIHVSYEANNRNDIVDNPIIPQSADITVYTDGIDMDEMMLIMDKSVRCTIYLNDVIFHKGFLLSDGLQLRINGAPETVTLRSIDGLNLMKDTMISFWNNYGAITLSTVSGTSDIRCLLNIVRILLYSGSGCSNPLPVRWMDTLYKSRRDLNKDLFAGLEFLSQELISNLDKITVYSLLENIMRAFHCVLYQRDGYWVIDSFPYISENDGVFDFFEVSTSTSAQTATQGTTDRFISNADANFIDHDQQYMMARPYDSAEITYSPTSFRGNSVIVNGDMERYGALGSIFGWWKYGTAFPSDGSESNVYLERHDAIDGRDGHSMEVSYYSTPGGTDVVVANSNVQYGSGRKYNAIDSNVLYKDFKLGFDFMPLKGFPYWVSGPDKGFIKWDDKPFNIRVTLYQYHNSGQWIYYLNEFGFWQYIPVNGYMNMAVSKPNSGSILFSFTGSPVKGNLINIQTMYDYLGLTTYNNNNYTVTQSEQNNLSVLMSNLRNYLETRYSAMGYIITSTSNSVTISLIFGLPSGARYEDTGSSLTTGVDNLNPDGSIPISVDKMKIGDVASISFRGKGNQSEIKLPTVDYRGYEWMNNQITVEFIVKNGQSYVLDNVYLQVSDVNDIYEVGAIGFGSNYPNVGKYELGISSSYNSHLDTNTIFNESTTGVPMHLFHRYIDAAGDYATLTELYARTVMNMRSLPCRIFEGSIDKIVYVGDVLDIGGKMYIVYNSEISSDGISKVTAFESVMKLDEYSVTHKSSNDK